MKNRRKKIFGLLIVCCLLISGYYSYQEFQKKQVFAKGLTDNPLDTIVELDPNGNKLLGTDFEPDRPVIRPAYQGDYAEIFKDVIGPQGVFTGFYDKDNHNATTQHSQYFKKNDSLIYRNVGQYNNKKVALKIDFLGPSQFNVNRKVGLMKDGSLYIPTYIEAPVLYQLVYDEVGYPAVPDILLDMPNETSIGESLPSVRLSSFMMNYANVNKVYLAIPEKWKGIKGSSGKLIYPVKRYYKIINEPITNYGNVDVFKMEIDFSRNNVAFPEFNVLSNNNQKSLIVASPALNNTSYTIFFKTTLKTAYTPFYLPIRGNGVGNSDKFEAKYDVGQAVTDAYASYLPDSLKIIVEDRQGYFENLQSTPNPIEFFEKDRTKKITGITTKVIGDKKLEFTISKAVLEKLQTNQVNMKLNFSNLNTKKVLGNYNSVKGIYEVPLTFYNLRTAKGQELKSEETLVNAEIIPNIYGEPSPIEVSRGSTSNDLNPNELVKNGVTTIPGDTLKMTIEGYQVFSEEKPYTVSVKLASTKTPSLTKTISVPITVKKGKLITSADFENQSWIINEINRQLAPKKIDKDVYDYDLDKITVIDVLFDVWPHPKEHIPKTIVKLKNLTNLRVGSQQLIGDIPTEIGDLRKLTSLNLNGNNFTGGIPSSLGNLKELSALLLYDNGLRGTIPPSIAQLPKLKDVILSNNQLSGQVPEFSKNMDRIMIEENQLTYNLAAVPAFLTSATDNKYSNTFIKGLQLTGKSVVTSPGMSIKPFNPSDPGYFNLKASGSQELYEEHTYTIKNTVSGEVYYTGKKNSQTTIPYQKGVSYTVILDEADKNPNNSLLILGKEKSLKFQQIPKSMSIRTKNGTQAQPVVLDGELAIFDNRDESHWKLKMAPSALLDGRKQLEGEYIYTDLQGNEKVISDNQAMLIEEGSSSEAEISPISAQWSSTKGLRYRLKPGNLLGSYKGSVTWMLEDAP